MVQTRSAARKSKAGRLENNNLTDAPHPDSGTNTSTESGVNGNYQAPQSVPTPTGKKRTRQPEPQEEHGVVEPSKRPRRCVEQDIPLFKLNTDALIHIVSCAHPSALINLARTCTFLRSFLMSKSSAFVWRAARRQLEGLPECPSDLSEQRYAHLFFDDCCHNCGKQLVELETYWKARQRLCPSCRDIRLEVIDFWDWRSKGWDNILAAECIRSDWSTRYYVDKVQLAAFRSKYRKPSKRNTLMEEMRQMCCIVTEHANQCEAWFKNHLKQREKSILDRLRQLGYDAEITFEGTHMVWYHHSAFKRVFPLTDQEWNDMLPEWLEIMQEIRTRRLHKVVYPSRQRRLKEVYNDFVQHPPSSARDLGILPDISDVAAFRPFDAIIKAPEETTISKESFGSAFAHLPTFVAEWRTLADEAVARIAKRARRASGPADADKPDIAVAPLDTSFPTNESNVLCNVFCVSHERKGYLLCSYPDILFLGIFQSLQPQVKASDTSPSLGCLLPREIWKGKPIFRHCEEIEHIVHACGLNPEVVTWDDMEERNARFLCLMCPSSKIPRTRTWIGALCHAEKHHHRVQVEPNVARWRLIDDEHISLIEEIEYKAGSEPSTEAYYRCLLCLPRVGDVFSSHSEMLDHLEHRHEIRKTRATYGVHYDPLQCFGIYSNADSMVEMIEKGDCVTFRVAAYPEGYNRY